MEALHCKSEKATKLFAELNSKKGIGLSRQGKKVLLIDADAQGNLTQMLGWQRPDDLSPTLSTLMEKIITDKPITPSEGILEHREGVHLMPANIELSSMEVTLVNTMSRETVLRQYLSLVGKVNYFWGGKSLVIGWDSRWGRVEKVTAAGRDGSGNLQIIHCSSGHNNVVVAGSKGFTAIGRPVCYTR